MSQPTDMYRLGQADHDLSDHDLSELCNRCKGGAKGETHPLYLMRMDSLVPYFTAILSPNMSSLPGKNGGENK